MPCSWAARTDEPRHHDHGRGGETPRLPVNPARGCFEVLETKRSCHTLLAFQRRLAKITTSTIRSIPGNASLSTWVQRELNWTATTGAIRTHPLTPDGIATILDVPRRLNPSSEPHLITL